jgi:hypothetical protein
MQHDDFALALFFHRPQARRTPQLTACARRSIDASA